MNTDLVNQIPVAVTYRDGRTETLAIETLTIRKRYLFIRHLGGNDTPALVALCAGKPVEWIDTLTDASYMALVAECIRQNFTGAMELVKNDPVALHQLGPLLFSLEKLTRELQPTNGPYGSGSSPAPASSASAVEIGSGSST